MLHQIEYLVDEYGKKYLITFSSAIHTTCYDCYRFYERQVFYKEKNVNDPEPDITLTNSDRLTVDFSIFKNWHYRMVNKDAEEYEDRVQPFLSNFSFLKGGRLYICPRMRSDNEDYSNGKFDHGSNGYWQTSTGYGYDYANCYDWRNNDKWLYNNVDKIREDIRKHILDNRLIIEVEQVERGEFG